MLGWTIAPCSSADVRALADELDAPVGGVLEGGYDLRALAASVAAMLAALRDGGVPEPVEPHPLALRAAGWIGRFWPLPLARATS
jgi:acetoin utilization deacetylase AcuC-like enzyme